MFRPLDRTGKNLTLGLKTSSRSPLGAPTASGPPSSSAQSGFARRARSKTRQIGLGPMPTCSSRNAQRCLSTRKRESAPASSSGTAQAQFLSASAPAHAAVEASISCCSIAQHSATLPNTQSPAFASPRPVQRLVQQTGNVKTIQHLQILPRLRCNHCQTKPANVAADKLQPPNHFPAQSRQVTPQGRLRPPPSHPQQPTKAQVNLVDHGQKTVSPIALAPVE